MKGYFLRHLHSQPQLWFNLFQWMFIPLVSFHFEKLFYAVLEQWIFWLICVINIPQWSITPNKYGWHFTKILFHIFYVDIVATRKARRFRLSDYPENRTTSTDQCSYYPENRTTSTDQCTDYPENRTTSTDQCSDYPENQTTRTDQCDRPHIYFLFKCQNSLYWISLYIHE